MVTLERIEHRKVAQEAGTNQPVNRSTTAPAMSGRSRSPEHLLEVLAAKCGAAALDHFDRADYFEVMRLRRHRDIVPRCRSCAVLVFAGLTGRRDSDDRRSRGASGWLF